MIGSEIAVITIGMIWFPKISDWIGRFFRHRITRVIEATILTLFCLFLTVVMYAGLWYTCRSMPSTGGTQTWDFAQVAALLLWLSALWQILLAFLQYARVYHGESLGIHFIQDILGWMCKQLLHHARPDNDVTLKLWQIRGRLVKSHVSRATSRPKTMSKSRSRPPPASLTSTTRYMVNI